MNLWYAVFVYVITGTQGSFVSSQTFETADECVLYLEESLQTFDYMMYNQNTLKESGMTGMCLRKNFSVNSTI